MMHVFAVIVTSLYVSNNILEIFTTKFRNLGRMNWFMHAFKIDKSRKTCILEYAKLFLLYVVIQNRHTFIICNVYVIYMIRGDYHVCCVLPISLFFSEIEWFHLNWTNPTENILAFYTFFAVLIQADSHIHLAWAIANPILCKNFNFS
jgi:hypothetical protein